MAVSEDVDKLAAARSIERGDVGSQFLEGQGPGGVDQPAGGRGLPVQRRRHQVGAGAGGAEEVVGGGLQRQAHSAHLQGVGVGHLAGQHASSPRRLHAHGGGHRGHVVAGLDDEGAKAGGDGGRGNRSLGGDARRALHQLLFPGGHVPASVPQLVPTLRQLLGELGHSRPVLLLGPRRQLGRGRQV